MGSGAIRGAPANRLYRARVCELVARAKAGDRVAFDALIAKARPRALALALRVLRNPEDAEDAVQEALLKVWRYFGRFECRASISTWIHRIVMNACLDLLRRQGSRPEAAEPGEPSGGGEPVCDRTPEGALGEAQAGALVRAALAELSPAHRQALTLREFESLSYEEIARAAGCPVGTVMSRLYHARRRLADQLCGALAPDVSRCAA